MKAHTIYIVLVLTLFEAVDFVSADCYKMSGCRSRNTGVEYKENDVFADVNQIRGSCAQCTCQKTKQFVASCMVVTIVPLKSTITKAIYSKRRMLANFAEDREIELTEDEAVLVKCEHETIPKFNIKTHMPQFHFINYVFVTWESYCCTKTKSYGDAHPYCKVTFDETCKPRAVLRDKPRRRCPMPLRKILRG
uniref:uncharacterized protein LOC120345596 n=1 Tax=Styela clava TaxID=7725 RepID=UPI00193982AC|nr:uncharacterized protein LOC120345596 [Styela clava]